MPSLAGVGLHQRSSVSASEKSLVDPPPSSRRLVLYFAHPPLFSRGPQRRGAAASDWPFRLGVPIAPAASQLPREPRPGQASRGAGTGSNGAHRRRKGCTASRDARIALGSRIVSADWQAGRRDDRTASGEAVLELERPAEEETS